jgi:signal transduction histidine kinase
VQYAFFLFLLLFLSCDESERISIEKMSNESLDFYFEKANDESLDYQSRHAAADSIRIIIVLQKNDSLNRINYFKLANRYFNMNAMDDYRETTKTAITNAQTAKDSVLLAKGYSYLGDYYGSKFESELAYQNYFYAEKIYINLQDDANVAKTLLNKSVIQFNEKDFVGSEKSAIQALSILRKTNNDDLTYEANNILGVIYNELSEFDRAIAFHNAALLILKKQNTTEKFQSRATSWNNIGVVYQKSLNYKKALEFYTKSLKIKNVKQDKPILYVSLIDNSGYSNFKLRNFEQLPQLFFEALKIRDSLNLFQGVIGSKLNLSEFYAYQKNIPFAQKFAKEAYLLAKEKNLSNEKLLSLKQLIKVDSKNAALYSANYIRINDSLQLSERQIRNKLARIEFETEELIIQKDRLAEQKQSLIYFGFALFIVGVFIYVLRIQASKNRELILRQEQQVANEEIYQLMITQQEKADVIRYAEQQKIALELHDGILGKIWGTRVSLGGLNKSRKSDDVEQRTDLIEYLKVIEHEIRAISHELSAEKAAIHDNFVQMISNFMANQKETFGTLIKFKHDDKVNWSTIDNFAKINLYRILQESFQNINKYANASLITVTFQLKNDLLELKVQDNGQGFDIKRKKKGIGLKNMLSRISNLDGTMQINSTTGIGTTLLFQVPINKPTKN